MNDKISRIITEETIQSPQHFQSLSPEELDDITQDVRACFLNKDAPELLAILEEEILQLKAGKSLDNLEEKYTISLGAVRSLKAGADMARLATISQEIHQLEDLLEELQKQEVSEPASAGEKLWRSIEHIQNLITQASFQEMPISLQTSLLEGDEANRQGGEIQTSEETPAPAIFSEIDNLPEIEKTQIKKVTIVDSASLRLHQTEQEEKKTKEIIVNFPVSSLDFQIPVSTSQAKIPQQFLKYIGVNPDKTADTASVNLRVPVARLDRMSNTVGELFIDYERLSLYQQYLNQASRELKKHAQQLSPIYDKIQSFYDWQSATKTKNEALLVDSQEISFKFQPSSFKLHKSPTLQAFQELMVRVHETRSDVDLIAHELQETLVQMRTSLEHLHEDLTESRLVQFAILGEQLQVLMQTLKQQHHKPVELVIEGKDTLVDQAILQRLQTPLTHLFRYAFESSIELPVERKAQGKSLVAKITLSATIQGSYLVVEVADDGRGIDPQKVYQQALKMGLIYPQESALKSGEILEFLFAPGFSTNVTLNDLSSQEVSLDIVRSQIGQMRGSVQIESGGKQQGTKFTISIPLTVSILTLLLCRFGQQALAIPCINVLEVISLSESRRVGESNSFFNSFFSSNLEENDENVINWQDRKIPLFTFRELLPYRRLDFLPATPTFSPSLGIVLNVCGEPVVVAVDALVGERELVLKPFDVTVPLPAYIAGCTVLGTGEVVPVLSPNQMGDLIYQAKQARTAKNSSERDPLQELRIKNEEKLLSSQFSLLNSHPPIPSILIVDDSITVRRALDQLLSKTGYHVVQCRDGKQALDELYQLSGAFDLVISDLEMPRLDGFALLTEIRAHPNTKHLPVVILTSRESESYRQQAKSLGATAYLTKPWKSTQLLNAIATLLNL